MIKHPALAWLRSHPSLVAVLGSLLVSAYFLAAGDAPNDDAYTYVRVADILLHEGVAAAFAHYPWATYPVLFAHLLPLGVDLFTAGLLLNALLYALLAYCFVQLVAQLAKDWPRAQRDSALLLATLVILLYPQLNEFRSMLIRDVGFWAFTLLGLLQLIRLAQRPLGVAFWRHGLGFCLALGIAFSFRAEALAYLLLGPALFVFLETEQGKRRTRDALRLGALVASSGLVAAALLLLLDVDLLALLGKFLATYAPFFKAAFTADEGQRAALSAVLFGEHAEAYSGEYLSLFLVVGLLGILLASLASAVSLPFALTLGLSALRARLRGREASHGGLALNGDAARLLIGFALINLGILLGFILITRFVSARYGMLFSLLLVTLVPIVLARARRPVQGSSLPPLPAWPLTLLFVYCFVDSFYSFGDRKPFLEDATAWVRAQESQAAFLSNNHRLAYASGRVEDYDRTPRYLSVAELRASAPDTHIAIEMNAQMRERVAQLEQEGVLERLIGFPETGEARILVLRRR